MDNLGDWLYILILIVAGISGLFSSGKKKRRPTDVLGQPGQDQEVSPRPTNEKSFWDFLEDTQEEKSEVIPPVVKNQDRKVVKKEKKKVGKPEFTKRSDTSPFLNHELASYNNFVSSGPLLKEVEEDETSMFEDESFRDLDELRKAIIYTEILNRKY